MWGRGRRRGREREGGGAARRQPHGAPQRPARSLSSLSSLPALLYFIFHQNVARPTPALLSHKPHPTHTMSTEHVVPAVGFVTDMTSELIGGGANGGAHERQQRQAARMGGRRKRGGPPRATHAAGCQPPGPSTCQGRALHAWLTPRLLGTRRHAPSRAGGGVFFPVLSLPVRGSAGRCPPQHPRVAARLPSRAPPLLRPLPHPGRPGCPFSSLMRPGGTGSGAGRGRQGDILGRTLSRFFFRGSSPSSATFSPPTTPLHTHTQNLQAPSTTRPSRPPPPPRTVAPCPPT